MKFKNLSLMLILVFVFMFAAVAFSQAPSATPAAGAAVVNGINNAANKVPSSLPGWLLTGLALLVTELGARGVPTAKPRSWFIVGGAVLGALIVLLQKVQALLVNVGTVFNNVNPPSSTP